MKVSIMKKIITASTLLVLSLFTARVGAQTIIPKIQFLLNLDYARFQYDEQNGFLEIYYSFYPKHLTYVFKDGKYRGGVILTTKIRDKATGKLAVDEKQTLKIAEADTNGVWYKFPFISKLDSEIPNGDYVLEVMSSDSLNFSRCDSIKLNLKIEPYGSELTSSDIELCRRIVSSADKTGLFYKNSLEVVPYPPLIFGSSTVPVLFYYTELYHVNVGMNYTVETEILNAKGELIRHHSKQRKYPAANSIEVGTTPISLYPSGKYIFRLSVSDEKQNALFKTNKLFYIYNPHIELALQQKEKEKYSEISAEDLDLEFQYARYLATPLEIKMFESLNSFNAKRFFLLEFWPKVAKGRGDLPPVTRNGYLARARQANKKFKAMGKKGWETDQGRVFMIYSQPDEIERVPSESESKPYEVWKYYKIENGVEFVFVEMGYGLMELVHSTKRGELWDDNWMRYIK